MSEKSLFQTIELHGGHEQVVLCHNKEVGLKAIIAIHNTALGPALGGTRMFNYKSDEEALTDVLRLSRGMTYKAALAGLNLGGGKAVIIGDSKTQKSEALFRAFGQFVNSLNGRYITAEDVGTSEREMEFIAMETPWVTGASSSLGGSGDPSPFTATGTLIGIKASVKQKLGVESLRGIRVAVQGLGHVGYHLVRQLTTEGARVVVADIDKERLSSVVREFGVTEVHPDEIHSQEVEVYAPCAMGAILNDKTISQLKCRVVAGAANNQLAEARHGEMLRELGILYAPDFVINTGGLINVCIELEGYSKERSLDRLQRISENLFKIFRTSESERISTEKAAEKIALQRIESVGRLKQVHMGMATRPFGNFKISDRE